MYLLLDKLYSSEGNVCYVFLNLETQRLYYHVNHRDTYTPRMIVENLPDKVIHERLKIERQSRKEKYVEKLGKGEDDWHLRDQPWTIIFPVEKYDSILNKMVQLKEIHFNRPQGVPAYRELFESWEDNIQFLTRHGIDNQMPMGMIWDEMEQNTFPRCIPFSDKKIIDFLTEYGYEEKIIDHFVPLLSAPLDFHIERVAIDIETQYDATLKPNAEVAAFPIVSISVVNNREGEKPTIFALFEDYREEGAHDDVKFNQLDIRLFDKERDLLRAFFVYMRRQPQILITYHGDNFDLPYIKNRCQRLGFKDKEIPIHVATSKKKKGTTKGFTGGIARWKGKIHIDIYRFFENDSIKNYTFQAKYRDVSLNEVSEALLGKGKIKIDDMNKLSTYDLIWYNYIDSDLTLALTTFNHDLTLKVMIALMRMTNSTMPDINRFGISTWAHNMLFSFMIQNNILIPNKRQLLVLMQSGSTAEAIIQDALYRGGQLDVIKGYYFDIIIIDFTGLYPNVCSKKNICWSTIGCPHPKCKSNMVPDGDYWTCTTEKGILSQIMGLLKDVRAEIYKPLGKTNTTAKVLEQTQKVLVNATLGVFGNAYAKMFCPAITACVTGHSRHAINTAEKIADIYNLICVYKHTDSTALIQTTGGRIDVKIVEQLLKEINTVLNLEMELEHRFQFMIVHSKANYLGVKEGAKTTNDIIIRGMMGKKRNIPDIVKGIFDKVKEQLIPIKNEETLEQQRKVIIELIRKSIDEIRNKKGSIEDYSMRIGLNKDVSQYTKTTPQHVKVAKQITKYKREYEGVEGSDDKIIPKGSIIEFVHVLRPCKVETILTAKMNNINVEKYIMILKSTLQQIIENIHITDLDLQGMSQTDIGDFFK